VSVITSNTSYTSNTSFHMYKIIENRKIWLSISTGLVALSLIFISVFGLDLGIDFTGGSLLEVKFNAERPSTEEVRELIKSEIEFTAEPIVVSSDHQNMIIRVQETEETVHQEIISKLAEKYPENIQEERFESIGPSIGQELKEKAIYAILIVILAIVAYIAYAFRKVSWPVKSWKYGVIAIVALVHDVIIVVGIFALLGRFMGVEVGLPFVAALLTILGYSVNDSIVVFDRIRENLGRVVKTDFEGIVNRSVNETITRSVNTSVTTLIVLLTIFFFGGASIKFFVLALAIGVLSGTYSSIFLASPLLVVWEKIRRK
jgi:preprotein translocase subunit SecF